MVYGERLDSTSKSEQMFYSYWSQAGHWASPFNDRTFWPKKGSTRSPLSSPELLRNKRALHYLVQEGLGLPIIESFLFRNFIWIINSLCGSEFASIVKTKYGRYKHKLLVKRFKYFFLFLCILCSPRLNLFNKHFINYWEILLQF